MDGEGSDKDPRNGNVPGGAEEPFLTGYQEVDQLALAGEPKLWRSRDLN